MNFDYLDCLVIKLTWWQKLYLKLNPFLIFNRRTPKTGLSFMHMLEKLKRTAKTDEERKYYEQMQKEWGEFCVGLNLGYWI